MSQRILRLPAVLAKVGLCRASIYQRMAKGTFPQSISLGGRIVGWLESDIDGWIARQAKQPHPAKVLPVRKGREAQEARS